MTTQAMTEGTPTAIPRWDQEDLAPIRDKVYSYLKEAILRGEYKPGDRLKERTLAEKLNISRTPIREALFRLESQKFVTTVPRKGVVVNEISRDEIEEVFMILGSLETIAVRLAAQKMDEDMRAEIDALIADIESHLKKPADALHPDDSTDINIRYNDIIWKASRNSRLHEMLSDLRDYIRAFANVSEATPGRSYQALEEHLDILHAVRDGQPDLAENYAKIHIEKARRSYLASTALG